MQSTGRNGSRGRGPSRPWEPWLYPLTVGVPVGVLATLAGLVMSVGLGLPTPGLLLAGIGVVDASASAAIWWRVRDVVLMWRLLDETVGRFDKHWEPGRPTVIDAPNGTVVVVSPPPALTEVDARRAFAAWARSLGMTYVGHVVIEPARSALGKARRGQVRIELAERRS